MIRMKYDYAIETLEYEIKNLQYKKDYPSMTAILISKSLDNKIQQLKSAIEVLKKGDDKNG